MAIIANTSEDIGDAYVTSINAAFAELKARSGIQPKVLSPYGGRRTLAEQKYISPAVSNPASSDHPKGRAVDIDNQRTLRNAISSATFEGILANHGWRNIDLSGHAFPSEPWHFANHGTGSAAAGEGTVEFTYIKAQLGTDYVIKLQTQLGVTADGIVGVGTVSAWQKKVGTPADGIWGHNSNVALQKFLGINPDGLWGAGTTAAIKAAIDANKFGAAPTPPNTRTVGPIEVNVRAAASASAQKLTFYAAGAVIELPYFVKGEVVNGVDLWFVDASKTKFAWAGGFTSYNTAGMTELPTTTPPTSQYPTVKYTLTKAGDFVTNVAPADWSNFENQYSVPVVADRKGFPAKPTSVVIHQWGNPGDYTLSSVINTFQTRHTADKAVSAHFVVNANSITQMVSLDSRAYHAGSGGNDFVGIEADPKMDPGTIANIRKVLEFLKARNGGVALTNVLHKNVPGASTSCGTWIEPHLAELNVATPVGPTQAEVDALKVENAKLQKKIDTAKVALA